MLAVSNTIEIKLGDVLQGSADGPLGIGALRIIFFVLVIIAERRLRS